MFFLGKTFFFPIFTPFFNFISLLHFRYRYWLSKNEIPILVFACFVLFFTLSIFEKLILISILIIGTKIGKIQIKHKIPLSNLIFKILPIQFHREEPLNFCYYFSIFCTNFPEFFPYESKECSQTKLFHVHLFYSYFFVCFFYSFVFLQLFINRFPWIYFFFRYFISFGLIFTNYSIFFSLVTIYSIISRLVVFRVDNNFPTLIGRLFEFTGQETKIEKVAITRKNIKIISHWSTRLLFAPKNHLKNIYEYDEWGYQKTFEKLKHRNLLSSGKIKIDYN